MTEKLTINGKDVWIVIEAHPMNRENPRTIPTEYFTVRYSFHEPGSGDGELVLDDTHSPRLFESPVAALRYANEELINSVEGRVM